MFSFETLSFHTLLLSACELRGGKNKGKEKKARAGWGKHGGGGSFYSLADFFKHIFPTAEPVLADRTHNNDGKGDV